MRDFKKVLDFGSKRLLVQAIALSGSDLSSSSKPWTVQAQTAQVVYEEFHEQVQSLSMFF